MLAKHCLQEFKLDCQLRRLTERTIKGYYNNTLNFLNYAEKHHEVVEVEEIRTVHIKHYVQYLLNKKLAATYINGILKCLRAYFHFAIQEEYAFSNPTAKVSMQREPKVLIQTFNDDEVRSLLSAFDYSTYLSARNKMVLPGEYRSLPPVPPGGRVRFPFQSPGCAAPGIPYPQG